MNDWMVKRPAVCALTMPAVLFVVRMLDWAGHANDPNDRPTVVFYVGLPPLWLFFYVLVRVRLAFRWPRS